MTSPGDPLAILDEICRDSLESSLASVVEQRAYSETQETSALFLAMHDAVAALVARVEEAERERDRLALQVAGKWSNDQVDWVRKKDRERVKVLAEALVRLTSYPLTWHPRSEAERHSFTVTLEAYEMARAALSAVSGDTQREEKA